MQPKPKVIRVSGGDTVSYLREIKDLVQKWKTGELNLHKQCLEVESRRQDEAQKQHQDMMQMMAQQVQQQQNQMQHFLFFPHILLPFWNIDVFTRLSVYSIYIFELLLIINHIYICRQLLCIIIILYIIYIYKCHLYNNHLALNFLCVLFLTAIYFSVLYLTSTCFKKTSHSGILSCFRLCHICNFSRVIR